MRIALITQEEPFYLPPALDALCNAREGEIVAMIVLPSFNETHYDNARRFYNFYGTLDFSRLMARFIWAKMADQLNRFVKMARPYSAAAVARRHQIPLYQPPKINAQEFVEVLRRDVRPDLMVSVAASQILKKRVLDIPPLGCINLHSAPLPRYQGMMPNFWTMVHGEAEGAVTIHYMDEKLDAGDIILQHPVPIYRDDSLHHLMVRSKLIGVLTLIEAVKQIEQGTAERKPMDQSRASYFSFPKQDDANRLRRMGHALL